MALHQPRCGFLHDDGSACEKPATRAALARDLGLTVYVPICDTCAGGYQLSESSDLTVKPEQ